MRSGILILLAAGTLWLFLKNKLSELTAIIIVGILMVGDLFFVDKNYVNNDSFVSARQADLPFEATPADEHILSDTTHYRVFEVEGNMSSARASYFHKSIGGYHAAKPRKMQQLFDYQIAKNNIEVLNMLNVKYIIQKDEKGQDVPMVNPNANGNAWFVNKVQFVSSADQEMKALDKLDSKNTVILNTLAEGGQDFKGAENISKDSTATIRLTEYKPNRLVYTSSNTKEGFGVFSEIYYPKGWKATIDGKETKIYNVNYVLRGLQIPAGKHTIVFKFEPQVVKTGSLISLVSCFGMILLIGFGIFTEVKRKKEEV